MDSSAASSFLLLAAAGSGKVALFLCGGPLSRAPETVQMSHFRCAEMPRPQRCDQRRRLFCLEDAHPLLRCTEQSASVRECATRAFEFGHSGPRGTRRVGVGMTKLHARSLLSVMAQCR